MLPSNLLMVWRRKGEILPRYAKLSNENLALAQRLIEAYTKHVGEKKKAVKALVAELEDGGADYRFVRGLSLLLDRRGSFVCKSKVEPADLRRRIFGLTETRGVPTSWEMRQSVLAKVGAEVSLSASEVEEVLYADLDEELFLEHFDAPQASELLKQYNLSLTQTLLFDSTELSFTTTGNWQRLFYTVKKLGLIYDAYRENQDFWVKIDGPASLFKLTKRYGTSIAKLLPAILSNPDWCINAKILWKFTNDICSFKIESQKHASFLRKPAVPSQASYDSAVEARFASQFKALHTGWSLKREPEPVIAGTQVMVPDFTLERLGIKIYVEVVGFWTEEYLLRKAKKLQQVTERMLLLVDEALACEKLVALEKRPHLHFLYYKNRLPLSAILRYLEDAFEEVKTKEITLLQSLPVKFTESALSYAEFAGRLGVSVEAVQTVLTDKPPKGYVALPSMLLTKAKLDEIDAKLQTRLNASEGLSLTQATQLIEAQNVTDASCILAQLGYKVKWQGINSQQAQVYKPSKKNA
ncbi:MAG: DUF790 family protein [Candidatus Bathyarchaeota archaeon]|nr:DUF790 family protein [Candidatus Bathyarchaeota archaeon]